MATDDKKEQLLKMMADMEQENTEKFFGEGDAQAGQKLADLAQFEEQLTSSCDHNWVMSQEDGHYYCSKCGADGDSPWDC